MKILPIALASLAQTLAVTVSAATLTVEITNAKSDQGFVGAAVYANAQTWLEKDAALRAERAPAAPKVVLVFTGLPPGRYAVSASHDENGNGQLDRSLIGLPTERYGMSRDARGTLGPPSFDDAVFELKSDTILRIQLN